MTGKRPTAVEKRSGSVRVDLDNRLKREHVEREEIHEGYWSKKGRADQVLISKFAIPDQIRSLHDRFKINATSTQTVLSHFLKFFRALCYSISTRIFGHVHIFRVGSQSDIQQD